MFLVRQSFPDSDHFILLHCQKFISLEHFLLMQVHGLLSMLMFSGHTVGQLMYVAENYGFFFLLINVTLYLTGMNAHFPYS